MIKSNLNEKNKLVNYYQLPLIDVAEQVGYSSEANFNRAFKKTGVMKRPFLL
ncbi:MAG: hypothetical protein BMS9Abin39_0981 [Ignavibacteria bacterium]|nr:MAG: hypothetical protein BMS9Abin39_0981 [Ignavibacteria bacterium]